MPDYDLGKAHGTIEIDYKGSGAKDARGDVQDVGDEATKASKKIETANKKNEASYAGLAEAAKKASASLNIDTTSFDQLTKTVSELEKQVTSATTGAVAARNKLQAAEEGLAAVRARGNATTKEVAQAEAGLRRAQQSTINAVEKLKNSTRALDLSRQQLAKTPDPKVKIDEDVNSFRQLIQHLQDINKNTKISASALNTFGGRAKIMIATVALAAPGVAGLGVALVSLAGLAGVAAGALASLGAVAGTLATGMGGIGDAFKAAGAQAKSAGSNAGASAKAQKAAAQAIESAKRNLISAERDLKDAQQSAARAAVDAAKQVVAAQRDMVQAQLDAVRAQQNLNKARQQATRDLEDMRDAITGGALDERQAVLDLQKATEDLAAIRADPTANASDIAQAVLNYDKATFALEQLRKANVRLGTDQAAAAAAGVAGSDQVVSAQDAIRSSADQVRAAQESLVAAQENVRQVQVDSARQISDAVQSVVDAQQAVANAYADAADAGTSAGAKLNDAMANLSPNARAFVSEVLSMKGAWDEVKKSVQDKLFAGLAAEVKPLASVWLPLLKDGMGKVATGLNGIAQETIAYLKTAEAQRNVSHIFDTTAVSVGVLKGVVRDLLAAFLDIASVGVDFLPGIAQGAADAAARFREFISAAKESGQLKIWMASAMETANQLWELLKNLGSIIASVFSGINQSGGGALNTLTALTGQIAEFLKSAEGQQALHSLGAILRSIGSAYGKVFITFLQIAADLLVTLEPFIVAFADAVGVYLSVALQGLAIVLTPIVELLGFLGPALGPVVAGLYAANKAVEAAKIVWGLLNTVMKANPFILIASLIIALVYLIVTNWDTISAKLAAIWQGIKDAAAAVWAIIYDNIIQPILKIRDKISEVIQGVSDWLGEKWRQIQATVALAWQRVHDKIRDIITGIRDSVKTGIDNVLRFFRELPGNVIDFLKSLPGKLANWAGDLIGGIIRGLGNMAHKIWEKLKQIVSDAWDSVLNFFGISSPSKLAAEAGQNITLGLAEGIASAAGKAVRAATDMASAVGNELNNASGSLATNLTLTGDVSGLPTSLGMTVPLAGTGGPGAAGVTSGGSGTTTVIHIDNLTIPIAGNLDPTNPVAFRQTMVRLKDTLLNLDKEYA